MPRRSNIPTGFKPKEESARRNVLCKDDVIEGVLYNRSMALTERIKKDWSLKSNRKSQTYFVLSVKRGQTYLSVGVFLEQLVGELEPHKDTIKRLEEEEEASRETESQSNTGVISEQFLRD